MKKLVVLTLLLCASSLLVRSEGENAFYLQLTMTRSERSKDSHSVTTVITISDNKLLYEKTYHGRNGGKEPERKEFTLKDEHKQQLINLVQSRNLPVMRSTEPLEEPPGIYRYFVLSVKSVVEKRKSFVSIKGARDDLSVKLGRYYEDVVTLIEETYRIIDQAGSGIVYESVVK